MKQYIIGGRKFELRPLTLRQRQLAAPLWMKILSALKKISDTRDDVSGLINISIELDAIILSEDNEFARFLATILTPADAEKWNEQMIEDNSIIMLDITEDVQAEVLQDFLLRQSALNNVSARSTQNSSNMNNHSINHNDSSAAL